MLNFDVSFVCKIMRDCTHRHFKNKVLAIMAVAELTAAFLAILSGEFFFKAELAERGKI